MNLQELHDIMPPAAQAVAFLETLKVIEERLKTLFTKHDTLVYSEKGKLFLKISVESRDAPWAEGQLEKVAVRAFKEADLDIPTFVDTELTDKGRVGPPGRKQALFGVATFFSWDTDLKLPRDLLDTVPGVRYEGNVIS